VSYFYWCIRYSIGNKFEFNACLVDHVQSLTVVPHETLNVVCAQRFDEYVVEQLYVCILRRKITFAQFEQAVKLLAEKKYPDDPDAVDKLKAKIIEGKGPTAHGVTVGDMRDH